MPKLRLDLLMVERGLAESRAKAQALIMAGQIRVDGEVEFRPARNVETGAHVEVARGPRFVSRGGEKLEAALSAFGLEARGRICADVGASTGGFTDCLLQHGAARVYAIDVGKGTLHWKLRQDERVVVMEETNARFLESLAEPVSLVAIDASFISLKLLLPVVGNWLAPLRLPEITAGSLESLQGDVVALIKPQFEAGREDAARGEGVIRDPAIHRQVLTELLRFAQSRGFAVRGLIKSPLLGPKGNVEFLAWLDLSSQLGKSDGLIEKALASRAGAAE